jgi:translation elongation factor EF-G
MRYLWGEYYLKPKTKILTAKPPTEKSKNLFVQMILDSIWMVYQKVQEKDVEMIEKIAKSLEIELPDKLNELLAKDTNLVIKLIMNKWMPLDRAVLRAVVECLPSPIVAQRYRLDTIFKKISKICEDSTDLSENVELKEMLKIKKAVENCSNGPDDPVVIFISKMVSTNKENINEHGLNEYIPEGGGNLRFYGNTPL